MNNVHDEDDDVLVESDNENIKNSLNFDEDETAGGDGINVPEQYSMLNPMSYLPNDTVTPLFLSQVPMPTPFSSSPNVAYENLVPPQAANITFESQGEPLSNYYKNLLNHGGSGF